MQLNLECRLAQRVLWPLVEGYYRDEHDLYDLARRVEWLHWITPEQTLRVDVVAMRSPLQSLNFTALRIKDAICDQLRETAGARPSVDTRHPDLPLTLFVGPENATLYADTSGDALFKRGWREDTGEAPLKETLAAAMLAAAGWQGRAEDGPLLDPCCGAGTIVIEAAQIACGIAAGGQRRFAFERMQPFKAHMPAWREMQRQAQARVHAPAVPIFAGDVSFRMTDFATRNAARAGVAHAIEFKTADALQRLPPVETGTVIMNPPYGERIEPKGQGSRQGSGYGRTEGPVAAREGFEGGGTSTEFFSKLAAHWKRNYSGWTAWLLSPDMKLPSAMRLKESRRVPLWNGAIECRLFRFDMVTGSPQAR
jgi:putative N6-adenine-specific DNA methylase